MPTRRARDRPETTRLQAVVIDKPYEFIPPYRSTFWVRVLGTVLPWHLRHSWGIESCECRGTELLRQSLRQGDGILLAPNHCRPCDPFVLGVLGQTVGQPFYSMASWHIF